MRVYRHVDCLPADARGAAVAIGNFDGLHLGHRAVLGAARAHADRLGRPLGALTFEPHPREVIAPERAPQRLAPFRRKAQLLAAGGVDHLYALRFTPELMSQPAAAFFDEVLVRDLGIAALAAGSDFCFGHRRSGDMALLQALAAPHGIAVTDVAPVTDGGVVCSSSAIRDALRSGQIETANRLLGYAYAVEGMVKGGDQRGRTIGFPTANVHPLAARTMLPAIGVYAVRASWCEDGRTVTADAIANLGRRPTFDGRTLLLEVHLLDRSLDLYGRRMSVAFLAYIRGEQRFVGIDELRTQIQQDCERAREIHALARA